MKERIGRIVIEYVPLFLIGWWISAMFLVENITMTDGWVTIVGVFLIWIFSIHRE